MEESKELTASTTLVTGFVDELVAALVNSRICGSEHRRVQASIVKLCSYLDELQGLTGEGTISIGVSGDFLVFQSRLLVGASITARRLIKLVQGWGSGGIQADVGASAGELHAFLEVLLMQPGPGDTHEAMNNQLERRQCRQVRLLAPCADDGDPGGSSRDMLELGASIRLYQEAVELLQNTTIAVCSGGRIQFDEIRGHAERLMHSLQRCNGAMLSVARKEQYDAFTFGHSVRVSVLAMNFARALTSDGELLARIGAAGLLHDVGKSVIPFELLHSGSLTEEERAEIARHPACGAEILIDHDEADDMAIATAFGHHRAVDSAGYPKTVHEHRQSLVTRIMKVCDVYETLTAARPHRGSITPLRAYGIMMGMTDHFDLRLLRKFIEANGVFPNGQLLEMSNGQIARVQRQGPTLLLPTVEVITDPEGHPLDEADRRIVALAADDAKGLCIARALDEEVFAGKSDLQQRPDEPGCC